MFSYNGVEHMTLGVEHMKLGVEHMKLELNEQLGYGLVRDEQSSDNLFEGKDFHHNEQELKLGVSPLIFLRRLVQEHELHKFQLGDDYNPLH